MKIKLEIDGNEIGLQKEKTNDIRLIDGFVPVPLCHEDLSLKKYDTMPNVFYYTNNLDFLHIDDCKGIEFFHNARGQNTMFMNKHITVYEDITNIDIVKSFYNRFDIYNIAWEILDCDSSKKDEIVKYLTQYCYLEILPSGKLFKYPFTVLSNSLFASTGLFTRIEARETFYIKLKRTYSSLDSLSFKKLSNFLSNTVLRIYLYGNYWLEKR